MNEGYFIKKEYVLLYFILLIILLILMMFNKNINFSVSKNEVIINIKIMCQLFLIVF